MLKMMWKKVTSIIVDFQKSVNASRKDTYLGTFWCVLDMYVKSAMVITALFVAVVLLLGTVAVALAAAFESGIGQFFVAMLVLSTGMAAIDSILVFRRGSKKNEDTL